MNSRQKRPNCADRLFSHRLCTSSIDVNDNRAPGLAGAWEFLNTQYYYYASPAFAKSEANICPRTKNWAVWPTCHRPNLSSVPASHAFNVVLTRIGIETVKVPQVAESITEGTLKTWTKKVGDSVAVDEEVATIETDKVDVSVNAHVAGKIVELLATEEDVVTVGQDLFRIEEGAEGEVSSSSTPAPEQREVMQKETSSVKEEPNVAKETKEVGPPPPAKKAESRPALKDTAPPSSSSSTIPLVPGNLTTFNEIDMSSLKEFRALYKDEVLKTRGVKLGFMSPFAKASTLALKEIPAANASIEDDTIVYRDYVDLSVAVATPKGLVTPVVRNIETMNFIEIEEAIANLGKKARDGQLTLEDMAGGTFTISNGGVFGSLYGTPIINLPQAAVLGMHSIVDRPTVVNGKIEIRPIMVVALTYDHRLLDGREAVTFLVRVKQYIEDPRRMLLV
ncbi:hypothetical protein BS47DRAFT_433273 [Hydnum rufescens UP504]|uniref:Dihydrolipoamide acetyltransferase component of pyruvate dehydrogenase complex n=1 Tax=Hydnum rufescens UP504 TaxID=1448309 RepID=A0A9P6DPJ5_9AGAM|nr:hypothetical protein BS47DRAFT_433273 [Hydnum rufescens UP504]